LTDKYSGYDSSIASILRGFDEWLDKRDWNTPRLFEWDYRQELILLADQAQREVDEARAAKGG
jgi:hypothetical protein